MRKFQKSFVALAVLLFAAALPIHAAPASRLAYAQQCAAKMGAIPAFNCLTGTIIPITKNDVAQSTPLPGEDCDRPVQLGLTGNSQCVPYSRLLRLNTGNAKVETVAICRKYDASDGETDPMFYDIAVIQHHKDTGETCFFQAGLNGTLDGTKVPSPQDNSAAASKYWLEAESTGPNGITCTRCHDADPFIWSPWIAQVAEVQEWNPFGKWDSNFLNAFGKPVTTFKPTSNGCASCHRIGEHTCNFGGAISTHEYGSKLLMPLNFTGTSADWHKVHDADMAQLDKCCVDPGLPGCNAQEAKGTPPSADRYAALWAKTAGGAWVARHGMSGAEYQQEFNKYVGQGMRLVRVDGYELNGGARYAALWEKKASPAWVARHGMTGSQYQQEFNKHTGQGYRLAWINGYTVQGAVRFAAIWEKSAGPAWVARHGMTGAEYQAEFNKRTGQGYRLKVVSGYADGSQARYAALWDKSPGPAWAARHGLSSSQYQQEFNKLTGQGFRLAYVNGYKVGGAQFYAAIWDKSASPAWVARHGMTGSDYQAQFNHLANQGFRLQEVSAY